MHTIDSRLSTKLECARNDAPYQISGDHGQKNHKVINASISEECVVFLIEMDENDNILVGLQLGREEKTNTANG